VDDKPNMKRKRLNDESIGIVKALFKFAKSFTKIELMKIEVQKEVALKTMENQLDVVWMFVEIMRSNGIGSGGGGGNDGNGSKDFKTWLSVNISFCTFHLCISCFISVCTFDFANFI
jgi:hypothetical protein